MKILFRCWGKNKTRSTHLVCAVRYTKVGKGRLRTLIGKLHFVMSFCLVGVKVLMNSHSTMKVGYITFGVRTVKKLHCQCWSTLPILSKLANFLNFKLANFKIWQVANINKVLSIFIVLNFSKVFCKFSIFKIGKFCQFCQYWQWNLLYYGVQKTLFLQCTKNLLFKKNNRQLFGFQVDYLPVHLFIKLSEIRDTICKKSMPKRSTPSLL